MDGIPGGIGQISFQGGFHQRAGFIFNGIEEIALPEGIVQPVSAIIGIQIFLRAVA